MKSNSNITSFITTMEKQKAEPKIVDVVKFILGSFSYLSFKYHYWYILSIYLNLPKDRWTFTLIVRLIINCHVYLTINY